MRLEPDFSFLTPNPEFHRPLRGTAAAPAPTSKPLPSVSVASSAPQRRGLSSRAIPPRNLAGARANQHRALSGPMRRLLTARAADGSEPSARSREPESWPWQPPPPPPPPAFPSLPPAPGPGPFLGPFLPGPWLRGRFGGAGCRGWGGGTEWRPGGGEGSRPREPRRAPPPPSGPDRSRSGLPRRPTRSFCLTPQFGGSEGSFGGNHGGSFLIGMNGKQIMQNLNDHFASYLEDIHSLGISDIKLKSYIMEWHKKREPDNNSHAESCKELRCTFQVLEINLQI
ncbi:formin-like protein 20 [Vombatus ursinus]|uniref:formin-like protein 20 n=1 Tax=Vombatus ursinus TaxID=29139 RepID=UPI000FFD9F7D|nr:formin-like protein 20 [Vombatus ursinus]